MHKCHGKLVAFQDRSARQAGAAKLSRELGRGVSIGQSVDKSVEIVIIHRNLVALPTGTWSHALRELGRANRPGSRRTPREVGRTNLYLKNLYLNLYLLPLWIRPLLVDLGITPRFGVRGTKIAFRRSGRSLRRERRAKWNGEGCKSSEREFQLTR